MITADDFMDALRDEGVPFIQSVNWKNRKIDGAFHPVGIMNHHTGKFSSIKSMVKTLALGHSTLPGPLCIGAPAPDGKLYLIAWGKTNHAGIGSSKVLKDVIAGKPFNGTGPDDTNGNPYFYGLEYMHPGDSSHYAEPMLEVGFRTNMALLRLNGWNSNHSIHHKEWTKRKIDMSWPGNLRQEIINRQIQQLKGVPVTSDNNFTQTDRDALNRLKVLIEWGFAPNFDKTPQPATFSEAGELTHTIRKIYGLVEDLKNQRTFNIDANAVALALATNTTFVDTLADVVVNELHRRLEQ